ncbi:MAG: DMT family transporter [Desulfobacteraceae bacterium]|nr:DMT family transporter [Desulfobacteraceae bacterium]
MSFHRFYKHPVPALIIGAVIISFSGIFVKTSMVPPLVSAFYRVFLGCLFLVCACWIKGEFKKKSLKKNLVAILCGLAFSLDLFCWHTSIKHIGPGLATILGNGQVFVLAIMGWLVFKERLGVWFVFSLPLVFLGLFMVIGLDVEQLSSDYLLGLVFGGLTAVFYSIFILLLRYLQSDDPNRSGDSVFYYQMVVTAAASFFLGSAVFASGDSFAIPGISSLFSLLGLGFLSQAFGWVLISNCLPKVQASRAGLILLLQPTLAFIWDVLFFNRQTGIAGWLGVVMVLIAIYLGMTGRGRKVQPEKV